MADPTQRFRQVRVFQRYVLNPPMKLIVGAGLSRNHILLETRGRKSGKRRVNVIGIDPDPTDENVLWVVAEHGRRAGYVANLSAEPRVRAKHQGQWRDATATPLPDDDPMPRLERWRHKRTSELIRKFGTQLLTIRIDVDEPS